METNASPITEQAPQNVVPMPKLRAGRIPKAPQPGVVRQRFRILTFRNRSGTTSYRVDGMSRDGRVRENFTSLPEAEARRLQLENDHLRGRPTATALPKITILSEAQLRLAETAFDRLKTVEAVDGDILQAVEAWVRQGRKHQLADCPRIDEAVDQFCSWLEETPTLRDRTKANLRLRIRMFSNGVPNLRVDAVTADNITAYLDARKTTQATKDNCRRVIGRFFSWCMEPKRRWVASNPASEVKVERGETPPPAVLSVDECEAMLRAAEAHRRGRMVPYLAVSLFGGLRPQEAARLTWAQVNLDDGEIRLEAGQTKTKRGRVVSIGTTLSKWLSASKGKPFNPPNWRRDFDVIKRAAGYGGRGGTEDNLKPWPEDAMRHTAISHKFRECGSYGLTAEWAGNSEAVIKEHYYAKVTSGDTKRFLAIMPKKGPR